MASALDTNLYYQQVVNKIWGDKYSHLGDVKKLDNRTLDQAIKNIAVGNHVNNDNLWSNSAQFNDLSMNKKAFFTGEQTINQLAQGRFASTGRSYGELIGTLDPKLKRTVDEFMKERLGAGAYGGASESTLAQRTKETGLGRTPDIETGGFNDVAYNSNKFQDLYALAYAKFGGVEGVEDAFQDAFYKEPDPAKSPNAVNAEPVPIDQPSEGSPDIEVAKVQSSTRKRQANKISLLSPTGGGSGKSLLGE